MDEFSKTILMNQLKHNIDSISESILSTQLSLVKDKRERTILTKQLYEASCNTVPTTPHSRDIEWYLLSRLM